MGQRLFLPGQDLPPPASLIHRLDSAAPRCLRRLRGHAAFSPQELGDEEYLSIARVIASIRVHKLLIIGKSDKEVDSIRTEETEYGMDDILRSLLMFLFSGGLNYNQYRIKNMARQCQQLIKQIAETQVVEEIARRPAYCTTVTRYSTVTPAQTDPHRHISRQHGCPSTQ